MVLITKLKQWWTNDFYHTINRKFKSNIKLALIVNYSYFIIKIKQIYSNVQKKKILLFKMDIFNTFP